MPDQYKKMGASATWDFVRLDDLLFSDEELVHHKTLACPWGPKRERMDSLFNAAGGPFAFRSFLYRYNAGARVGGYWNFLLKLPSKDHTCQPVDLKYASLFDHEIPRLMNATETLKNEKLPSYLPKAFLKAIKDRYKSKVPGLAAAGILDELIAFITGDASSGTHGGVDKALRERVELFLEMDEEDVDEVVVDLRRHNGTPEVYSKFYEITAEFIDSEETKVDDRRHQGLSTLPVAWSVPNFINNVIRSSKEKAWQEKDPEKNTPLEANEVPTAAWVRLLFCPSNPWVESSKAS